MLEQFRCQTEHEAQLHQALAVKLCEESQKITEFRDK